MKYEISYAHDGKNGGSMAHRAHALYKGKPVWAWGNSFEQAKGELVFCIQLKIAQSLPVIIPENEIVDIY